jgi:hypothetical protein
MDSSLNENCATPFFIFKGRLDWALLAFKIYFSKEKKIPTINQTFPCDIKNH